MCALSGENYVIERSGTMIGTNVLALDNLFAGLLCYPTLPSLLVQKCLRNDLNILVFHLPCLKKIKTWINNNMIQIIKQHNLRHF